MVAGVMAAGADCNHTLQEKPRSMNLDEFIEFLEPQAKVIDPNTGQVIKPARGPALCQSSDDWNKMKTALEQACKKLGPWCSYEIKTYIQRASKNLASLQSQSYHKKAINQSFACSHQPNVTTER